MAGMTAGHCRVYRAEMSSEAGPRQMLFSPLALGGLQLPNRIIKTATYEGMVVDGLPSASLVRHHVEVARGGVGMTTVAYCAVSPDGRTFENQMVMDERTVPHLRALTDAVHGAGARAMLQLGHAGGFSKNAGLRGRRGPLGPSFGLNPYGVMKGVPFTFAMRPSDIEATLKDFVRSAVLAREAGFDAVELHAGHGYLLSQFASPHRNRRTDAYGGTREKRMRFACEVVSRVRETLDADTAVFVKMNLDDGVSGGVHADDAVEHARMLEAAGADALVLSGGLVSHSAFYLVRGERPLAEMVEVETNPLQKLAVASFGRLLVKEVPFEPMFFLPDALRVRAAVRIPLVLLGGITSLEHMERAMTAGFELIALGRPLIHDPELVTKLKRGELSSSGCTPCNRCITEMDRPGGVCCARLPAQLARRAEEVAAGMDRTPAGC
jgi:2,4-dienoyl-CoA reductase-like NADH-dependent reductase (Old Yellow Enzyme family)